MTGVVGELDELWQECGMAFHHVVGIVDDDDQPRDRRKCAKSVLGGLLLGELVLGEVRGVHLRQQPRSATRLGLQGTKQSDTTVLVELAHVADDVFDT